MLHFSHNTLLFYIDVVLTLFIMLNYLISSNRVVNCHHYMAELGLHIVIMETVLLTLRVAFKQSTADRWRFGVTNFLPRIISSWRPFDWLAAKPLNHSVVETRILRGRTRSTPLASYQICQIAGCACAGNAGNVSPPPTSKETAN